MKAGFFVAAALVQIAAAQPHQHAHLNAHQKRQVYVTDVSYATVTAVGPDVIVYVDANGKPVATSTLPGSVSLETPVVASTSSSVEPVLASVTPPAAAVNIPAPEVSSSAETTTAAPAPTEAPTPPPASETPAPAPAPAPAPSSEAEAPAPAPTPTPAPAPAPAPAPSSGGGLSGGGLAGTGIVYNAYNADGTCKSQDQVDTDFNELGPKGYGLIRIYGTDCNQVTTVGSNVRKYGMKLFAGIFDINDVYNECQSLISQSNGDLSYIDTVSVGNELVNNGEASAGQVIAALGQARGILNGAGYTGSMVIVDTFNAVIANPSICGASDYAAVNAHPFFDSSIFPGAAGAWAIGTKALVQAACGGKRTVITETGMPWGGSCNGLMCPSPANQASAISSLHSAFPDGGIILLSSFNDLWKQNNAGTFWAEQSWGIYGNAPTS